MDLFGDLPEPTHNAYVPEERKVADHSVTASIKCGGIKRKTEEEAFVEEKIVKKTIGSDGQFVFKCYVKERKGEREEMQDAHSMMESLEQELSHLNGSSVGCLKYYGVFDGHGGCRAAKYAAKHLHSNIALKFPKGDLGLIERDIKKCFTEAFKKTDDDFLKQATKVKPSWKDGTTVVVVLLIGSIMYIANLGDSKAVLARYSVESKKIVAISLTKDHTPTQYEERMRIQRAGGHVRDGRVMGVLEVSRSIGDGQFKTCGLTCIPDVKRCQLTDNDRFVILACDGLWKVFTPTEAVNFVLDYVQDESVNTQESKIVLQERYEAACAALANEAVRKGSGDNITVLLVSINKALVETS